MYVPAPIALIIQTRTYKRSSRILSDAEVKAIATAVICGPSFGTPSAVWYVQPIALEPAAKTYSFVGFSCNHNA